MKKIQKTFQEGDSFEVVHLIMDRLWEHVKPNGANPFEVEYFFDKKIKVTIEYNEEL